MNKFYDKMRWKSWQPEVARIDGSQGIACYPFLFTEEGKQITKDARKAVPIQELWLFHNSMRKQLGIH